MLTFVSEGRVAGWCGILGAMKDDWHSTVPGSLVSMLEFVLKCTDVPAVWRGVLVWEAVTRKPLPAEVKRALYFGAFASASFSVWRKERLRAGTAEAALAAEKKNPTPARVFAGSPAGLLDRNIEPGMRAEKLLVPYLNRWIWVSGRFEGTADSLAGDAVFVSLILDDGRRRQLCFSAGHRDGLRRLREGQQVTAMCQIRHGYGAGVFPLENCEPMSEPYARLA